MKLVTAEQMRAADARASAAGVSTSSLMEAAGLGVGAALLLSAHLGPGREDFHAAIEAAARAHGMRILGPHCLGILSAHARINASIAARAPEPGDLALVSESSAIAAALVEWGVSRSIGFSKVVSLGDALDVDFADLLDYLATDRHTRAILLYVENVGDARKFMSAARAAAHPFRRAVAAQCLRKADAFRAAHPRVRRPRVIRR